MVLMERKRILSKIWQMGKRHRTVMLEWNTAGLELH